MKARYGGPISVEDLMQAIFQDKVFFEEHGIRRVKNVYLYFTPIDEFDQPVMVCDQVGNVLNGYNSAGAYHCIADNYEPGELEPTPTGATAPKCTVEK